MDVKVQVVFSFLLAFSWEGFFFWSCITAYGVLPIGWGLTMCCFWGGWGSCVKCRYLGD